MPSNNQNVCLQRQKAHNSVNISSILDSVVERRLCCFILVALLQLFSLVLLNTLKVKTLFLVMF